MEETSEQPKKIELNDGNLMPLLGLGTWKGKNKSPELCQGAAETAIAAGYRHLDTAYCYENEVELGKAIHSKIQQGIIRRQDMFIVSKLWCTHYAPKDIPLCLNKSLSDLQLDYLDLYLVHFPVALQKVNNEMLPMKDGKLFLSDIDYVDAWKGMEALKLSGKVKSIGVSNFSIQQLERLLSVAKIPPAVNEVELHPYYVQSDLIEYCKSKNIALTAYSPFGSPAKPEEYHQGDKDPEKLLEDPVVAEIAAKHKRTPAQILLRYHIEQNIAVVPQSFKPNEILENTKVGLDKEYFEMKPFNVQLQIFDFCLDAEDMSGLRSLNRGWKAYIFKEFKSHPNYPFK